MSALGTLDLRLDPDALLALADHTAALREHAGALTRFAAALEAQAAAPSAVARREPQPASRVMVVPPPPARTVPAVKDVHWATEDRKEVLRHMVPNGADWPAIMTEMERRDGPPLPDMYHVRGYAFSAMGLRRDQQKLRPIDRQRVERLAAGKAAQLGASPAPSGGPIAHALAAAAPKPDRTPPVALTPAVSKPAPQQISRAEALARVGQIGAPAQRRVAVDYVPIEVDLDQVRTWASQRGLQFRDWDDLPGVNRKREQLGQATFKRKLPGRSVHQAGVGS